MISKQFGMFLFAAFSTGWGMPEVQHWMFGNFPTLGASLGWTSFLVALGISLSIATWCLRAGGEQTTYGTEILAPSLCIPAAVGIMAQYGTTLLWSEPRSWPRLGVAAAVYLIGVVGYAAAVDRRRSVRNRHLLHSIARRKTTSPSSRCPECGWDLDRHSLYSVDAPRCDDCWILWRLRDGLVRSKNLPPEPITPAATIPDDLELDSLDFLGFLLFVEHDFSITIRSDEMGMLKTVGDLIQLIRQRSDRIGFVQDDRYMKTTVERHR
jgi:acyl carrier protein